MRKERLGYIKVLRVWQERLRDISQASIKREGYNTRENYFQIMRNLHGKVDLRKTIWAVRFKWKKTKNVRD